MLNNAGSDGSLAFAAALEGRTMKALDRLVPTPGLLEVDHVDVAAPPERVWEIVRHLDLASLPIARALFAIRTLADRLRRRQSEPISLRIDDLRSSPAQPGFAIFVDDPPHEVVIAAIGKVWHVEIPFVHTSTCETFAAFAEPDFAKVAWAVRVLPHGERDARVEVEVRVDATDEAAWRKFRRYFRLIGPGSRMIRHSFLARLARELGSPAQQEQERPLPGDGLIADAGDQITQGITIHAAPAAIWPWLVQMGCRRAGFYSIDMLDNGNRRSSREIHPELQHLAIGEVIPATPDGGDGFEVLAIEPQRCLILGGLWDADAARQLRFSAPRPARFWQVSWAFVLEPLDDKSTRLHVRARAAFPKTEWLHAAWIRPVHHLMESAQLAHLAARAEGRLARDDWRDVESGLGGAAVIIAAMLTPFLRRARNHWGLDESTAARTLPGDELVPNPGWSWTHGIEIDAPASAVWPWVAQIGADRGGFYSYQWLENLVGCEVRNAERIHDEWQVCKGDSFRIHPKAPPLTVVEVVPESHFVVFGGPDPQAVASQRPWVAATWLFFIEPLRADRCRLISRYRCAGSDDVATRLMFGPALMEPIGFAMDRRMLMGIRERAAGRPTAAADASAT